MSGRLKVAPEHTSDRVLNLMRKPSFCQFEEFKHIFDQINQKENLREQIIPYFISSHPGCTEEDMAELAVKTKKLDFHLEQVQDFTPTPMTVSTESWYTGYNPYTLEPVFCAKSPKEKLAQRQFFFWYKPEERRNIESELRRIGRTDLIPQLYSGMPYKPHYGKRVDTFGDEQQQDKPWRKGRKPQPTRSNGNDKNYRATSHRQEEPRGMRRRHRGDR